MVSQPQEGLPQEFEPQLEPVDRGEGATILQFRRPLPPGMAAILADLAWLKANDEAGYGKFGVAEYKRDDEGRLYVDQHGPRVYLD